MNPTRSKKWREIDDEVFMNRLWSDDESWIDLFSTLVLQNPHYDLEAVRKYHP